MTTKTGARAGGWTAQKKTMRLESTPKVRDKAAWSHMRARGAFVVVGAAGMRLSLARLAFWSYRWRPMFSFCHADHNHLSDRELILHVLANQKLIHMALSDIQKQNDALLAAVKAEDTVIDSAVVLITGFSKQLADLQAQLAAAIAANDPVATQAVADSMAATVADINAKTTALGDAVAGTPA